MYNAFAVLDCKLFTIKLMRNSVFGNILVRKNNSTFLNESAYGKEKCSVLVPVPNKLFTAFRHLVWERCNCLSGSSALSTHLVFACALLPRKNDMFFFTNVALFTITNGTVLINNDLFSCFSCTWSHLFLIKFCLLF